MQFKYTRDAPAAEAAGLVRRAATTALRITALLRSPDVIGRVRRPANSGKRLAAVIVGGGFAGETTSRPPVQNGASIGAEAAGRSQALEEASRRRRAARLCAQLPPRPDQGNDPGCDPDLASHFDFSPEDGSFESSGLAGGNCSLSAGAEASIGVGKGAGGGGWQLPS